MKAQIATRLATRITAVKVHLILASVFMPFMLIMPLSGGLYLLDVKGDQAKTEVFKVAGPIPEKADDFFREQFKAQNIDFDFEYIRGTDKEYIFRPTSRVHFVAAKTAEGATVSRIDPDWIKRLMEIHKGHGPKFIRWFEIAFALSLILVTLSGVYLAWTVAPYRRIMGISFLIGALIVILGVIL